MRIDGIAPFDRDADPEYVHGLREAIHAAIDYTFTTIECGEEEAPPIPIALLGQARVAARYRVPIGTVLRRYSAGANLVCDFLVSEAERDESLLGQPLRQILREQNVVLERILAELQHEYAREPQKCPTSMDTRLAEVVRRRLAGEPADMSDLNYDLNLTHIGVVTETGDGARLLNGLANAINGRLLRVRADGSTVWAWIGTRHRVDPDHLQTHSLTRSSSSVRLGLGEPGTGSFGWCQTHRQALEAFPYALRTGSTSVRYEKIALRAAIESHDLAATSLHQIYVEPFERRAGGDVLLETLRAYFSAGRNAASAQAALKVSRQTVSKRLRSIEAVLRKPLATCCSDLEIALQLQDLDDRP